MSSLELVFYAAQTWAILDKFQILAGLSRVDKKTPWSIDHNSYMYFMNNGTFLQQLECGYEFPALIHVWIASAGVLELFISTSGEATSACKPF